MARPKKSEIDQEMGEHQPEVVNVITKLVPEVTPAAPKLVPFPHYAVRSDTVDVLVNGQVNKVSPSAAARMARKGYGKIINHE